MKGKQRLYIAYGSNLNLEQMAFRCPTAKVVGKSELKDYELLFRSNQGLKELLYHVWQILSTMDPEPTVYEKEYVPEYDLGSNLPYTVEKTDAHLFTVEGPRIEKMLGYTNLDSEKGFTFFQRFLKETGILKELEDLGIEDGDTVKMYGQHFDYYHE